MNPWRGLNKLPREVWVITFTTFINRVGTMVFPLLIFYLPGIGLSGNETGFIIGLFGFGSFMVAPIAGRLADRIGALQVMRLSLALSGVILLLYQFTNNVIVIAILTLAWAITSEAFRPASYAILVTAIPLADPEKATIQTKQAQALSRLAINLGMAIGPLAASLFAKHHLWKWLFILDGLTSVAAFTYLSLALGPRAFRVPARASTTLSVQPFKDKKFIFFLLAIVPVLVVFFQEFAALPQFMKADLHLDESAYGMLVTLNAVLVIVCEIPFNTITGKWSYARSLVWGSLLCGVGYGALAFGGGFRFLALTVAVWTFGEMLLLPNMVAYVSSVAPPHRQGEYMGLYSMVFSFSLTVGPSIGLITLNHFGGTFLWTAAFILAAISAITVSRLSGYKASESVAGRLPGLTT